LATKTSSASRRTASSLRLGRRRRTIVAPNKVQDADPSRFRPGSGGLRATPATCISGIKIRTPRSPGCRPIAR
jgi:hypothetical protein